MLPSGTVETMLLEKAQIGERESEGWCAVVRGRQKSGDRDQKRSGRLSRGLTISNEQRLVAMAHTVPFVLCFELYLELLPHYTILYYYSFLYFSCEMPVYVL